MVEFVSSKILVFLVLYSNEFRIFLSLMETAGLIDLLKQEGSYTVFAPTDDAFEVLSKEDFGLLKSEFSIEFLPRNFFSHCEIM